MRRTFHDDDLREWEAYVSGGQPDSEAAARIYFLCLTDPRRRPRFVPHESGDVASTERGLLEMEDTELQELLKRAELLD